MYSTGGEHLPFPALAPGTPAPRPTTDSRVVAAGQSPTTTSNIARLASRGTTAFHPTASLLPSTYCATPDPSTCVYVPYRHVRTGECAMVPLHLDPATGIRTPVVSPPAGFHPAMVDGADEPPNLLKWLAGLLCRHPDEPAVDLRTVPTTMPVPPTRQRRLSPVDIRQPDFDDGNGDGAYESAGMLLSTKTLSSLKTKLELPKINDFKDDDEDEDVSATCGLVMYNSN